MMDERYLRAVRDALVRHGFLGLGSKETLQFSGHAEAFEAVVASERLYRKR